MTEGYRIVVLDEAMGRHCAEKAKLGLAFDAAWFRVEPITEDSTLSKQRVFDMDQDLFVQLLAFLTDSFKPNPDQLREFVELCGMSMPAEQADVPGLAADGSMRRRPRASTTAQMAARSTRFPNAGRLA